MGFFARLFFHRRPTDEQLYEGFTDWVGSRPRDEAYPYYDGRNCAFATYLTAKGVPFHTVGGSGFLDRRGVQHNFPAWLRDALNAPPDIYGYLYDRLIWAQFRAVGIGGTI